MLSGELLFRRPATRIFLRALGIKVDPFSQLEEFKRACEQANPRYEGGRDLVRFELNKDDSNWPDEVRDVTLNLAGTLGMRHGETPLAGKYDMIIALGGANRSVLHRACYAVSAMLEGRAGTKILVIAGSTRSLRDDEKPNVQDFAKDAQTEYDLCVGAAKYILERHPNLNVVTICKDDPKSGNDGVIDETMKVCATQFGAKPLRVAAVTTRIYIVGLDLDMARAAKRHNWSGFSAAGYASDPETVYNRKLAIYFSECLTTLRKAAIAAAEDC